MLPRPTVVVAFSTATLISAGVRPAGVGSVVATAAPGGVGELEAVASGSTGGQG